MPKGKTGFRNPQARRQAEGKYPFWMIVAGQTNGTALANPAITAGGPEGDGGQSATQNLKLEDNATARLIFGGVGAANTAFNYQVILWHVLVEGRPGSETIYVPSVVASGLATLGALVRPLLGGVAAGKICDLVTDTVSQGGTVLDAPEDDLTALLQVDCNGASWISVETDLTTATSADVFVALGD